MMLPSITASARYSVINSLGRRVGFINIFRNNTAVPDLYFDYCRDDGDQKPLVSDILPRHETSRFNAPIEITSSSSPREPSEPPVLTPQPVPVYDDFGPAAGLLPPFLFPSDVDETGRRVYSCRPGGEKLYDVLNMPPLKQHGLMAWQIIETEELLFEQDDMRDEDKVILALWLRWIRMDGHQNM
jgi:hypothetical protein